MATPIRYIALVLAALIAAACSVPTENLPPQNSEFEEQLLQINREAERRMEEMIRENEEILDQFGVDEDPLRVTGFGG
jgi:hypothetical protein